MLCRAAEYLPGGGACPSTSDEVSVAAVQSNGGGAGATGGNGGGAGISDD